jgi:dTDP-4-dehydrorhamnose 3,5-epimerase-like enzyme
LAHIIELRNFSDPRGILNVAQNQIPFDIKRTYWIHGVPSDVRRGGHRHHRSSQALICLGGSCSVFNNDGQKEETFVLDAPNKILIIEPKDWHIMYNFTANATLMVLASTPYDLTDYIDTPYPNTSFLVD